MRRSTIIGGVVATGLLVATACGTSTPATSTGSSGSTAGTTAPAGSATSAPATGGTAVKAVDAAAGQKYQKVLDDMRAQAKFPGAVAMVASPNGTWIGSTGTVGEGKTGAPTPSDRTRVGSLTKTMTATILLQLVQEGKLSLDDKIGKYVPGMPNGDVATLEQLAEMTSGIEAYTLRDDFQKQLFADPTKAWTAQELVDFEKGQPAQFAPGTKFEYSNTNYVLLGMVIEQVTGKPLQQVFQDRLFGPLGMTSSVYPGSSNAISDPHLHGLTEQGQPDGKTADATDWNPSSASTAGEVISTVDDLKKWADALFTGKGILDPKTQQFRRDSINGPDVPPNTATAGYGFGIGDLGGWWGHDGQIPGYTTSVMHNYDSDTTIIVVVNSDIPISTADKAPAPAPALFKELAKAQPSS